MRIVAVADTHGYEADLGVLPEGDCFVHAGDLCRAGTLDELERTAEWMLSLPHPHKIVVAGNHDWCFARESVAARALLGASITYLQDSECTLGGLRFWGSPWQPEFFGWAFNHPRGDELRAIWKRVPAGVDVLITHGPPRGFGDYVPGSGPQGCDDLLEELQDRIRPSLHLFGHIHEDGGAWTSGGTVICNVTTWEGERGPTVIDLEPGGPAKPVLVPPRAAE